MTDLNYPLSAEADPDDLPRTLRREREAREREARERAASGLAADPAGYGAHDASYDASAASDAYPAVVRRYDVPFFHLMMFFLKAVLAAIPALILLTAILWGLGQALQTFFPELVKMKILITFPNG